MKTQIMIDPHQSVLTKTAENGQLFEHENLNKDSLINQINRDIKAMNPIPSGMCGITIRDIDENDKICSDFSAFITISGGQIRKW